MEFERMWGSSPSDEPNNHSNEMDYEYESESLYDADEEDNNEELSSLSSPEELLVSYRAMPLVGEPTASFSPLPIDLIDQGSLESFLEFLEGLPETAASESEASFDLNCPTSSDEYREFVVRNILRGDNVNWPSAMNPSPQESHICIECSGCCHNPAHIQNWVFTMDDSDEELDSPTSDTYTFNAMDLDESVQDCIIESRNDFNNIPASPRQVERHLSNLECSCHWCQSYRGDIDVLRGGTSSWHPHAQTQEFQHEELQVQLNEEEAEGLRRWLVELERACVEEGETRYAELMNLEVEIPATANLPYDQAPFIQSIIRGLRA